MPTSTSMLKEQTTYQLSHHLTEENLASLGRLQKSICKHFFFFFFFLAVRHPTLFPTTFSGFLSCKNPTGCPEKSLSLPQFSRRCPASSTRCTLKLLALSNQALTAYLLAEHCFKAIATLLNLTNNTFFHIIKQADHMDKTL